MRAGPKKLKAPCQKTLDLNLAQQIVSNNFLELPGPQSTADLSAFTSITPEAIKYLSQFNYTWVDFGLAYLSPTLAREIAAWPVEVFKFKNGMETSHEALACFHRCQSSLRFGNITEALNLKSAHALSEGGRFLEFTTDELEPEIAEQIFKHHGWLEIRIQQPVSSETMCRLANHAGEQCQIYFKQPLTPELLKPLIDSTEKRFLDISSTTYRGKYENVLLICRKYRYEEIMSFLDLPRSMELGPIQ